MKFRLDLDISAPRNRVVELFLDPENLSKWQPELVAFEFMGGATKRDLGVQMRQVHKMGARETELIETITVHDPPENFASTYESEGIWNLVENQFTEQSDDATTWVLDFEFKCDGWAIWLMTIFWPSLFKKQTLGFMKRFKEFAEQSVGE